KRSSQKWACFTRFTPALSNWNNPIPLGMRRMRKTGGAATPLPVFAEIFQISGRKNCRETIFAYDFCSGKWDYPPQKIRPCPPYMPPDTIEIREGVARSSSPRVSIVLCAVCTKQSAYFCAHRHFSRKMIK
ncbi:MAG: hypothetical protein PUI95_12940, partial [Eubacteriales bacterium]|nr:hypothetical protein [Eubacteriales bacterium]